MLLESVLAYAHFLAIFSVVVFLTSEAALCRVEWMNAAVVRRLARLDLIYLFAAIAVLLTGWLAPTGVSRAWAGTGTSRCCTSRSPCLRSLVCCRSSPHLAFALAASARRRRHTAQRRRHSIGAPSGHDRSPCAGVGAPGGLLCWRGVFGPDEGVIGLRGKLGQAKHNRPRGACCCY